MITEKSITVYECSCSNCGAKFTVPNDGVNHDYWLKKEDLEDWLREDDGWELFGAGWYCTDCLIYDDGSVPRINEARRLLTAKEQVLKVYPDAKKHYSIRLAEWAIIAGNKHKSFAFISDFTFTEQQAWESALAIINDNSIK